MATHPIAKTMAEIDHHKRGVGECRYGAVGPCTIQVGGGAACKIATKGCWACRRMQPRRLRPCCGCGCVQPGHARLRRARAPPPAAHAHARLLAQPTLALTFIFAFIRRAFPGKARHAGGSAVPKVNLAASPKCLVAGALCQRFTVLTDTIMPKPNNVTPAVVAKPANVYCKKSASPII